ncbi:hypothetical protein L1987_82141 [Smallanthus sonchifolius]|uniref:Uncharacterized protein n=1 Tax=Smallanthus sonchifolius TaxID=185202 RepID=A0ACB8YTI2_9ASTR|nr:hypothetical protein L1987_82141 [Smallanthus sonchifolius]
MNVNMRGLGRGMVQHAHTTPCFGEAGEVMAFLKKPGTGRRGEGDFIMRKIDRLRVGMKTQKETGNIEDPYKKSENKIWWVTRTKGLIKRKLNKIRRWNNRNLRQRGKQKRRQECSLGGKIEIKDAPKPTPPPLLLFSAIGHPLPDFNRLSHANGLRGRIITVVGVDRVARLWDGRLERIALRMHGLAWGAGLWACGLGRLDAFAWWVHGINFVYMLGLDLRAGLKRWTWISWW